MKVRLQLPEVFVLGSVVLFCTNLSIHGWIFFALGLLGSIFRMGVQLQEQQKQAETLKGGVDLLKEAADEFLKAFAETSVPNQKKKTRLN
jgi:hypothetical protein